MPSLKKHPVDQTRFEVLLGYLLRGGVILAALVSVGGLVLLFVRQSGGAFHAYDSSFHGEPSNLRTLRGVLAGALALQPKPSMQLGLLILLATPVARVAFSVIGFAFQRDRFYVAVTLLVLALLVAGLLGAPA